jgi:hypothetical protein
MALALYGRLGGTTSALPLDFRGQDTIILFWRSLAFKDPHHLHQTADLLVEPHHHGPGGKVADVLLLGSGLVALKTATLARCYG